MFRTFCTAICCLLLSLSNAALHAQQETVVGDSLAAFEITQEAFPVIEFTKQHPLFEFAVDGQQHLTIKNPCLGKPEHFTILGEDEVWVIDARDYVSGGSELQALEVSRFVDGRAKPSDLSALTACHASDDSRVTMLYVHGNQTDEEWALFRGFQVYRNALTSLPESRAPVRFVIWIWRSECEKIRRFPDFQIKAERSMQLGETFAATLNQFGDRNVVVFGYSLGAQVLLSAFDSPSLTGREADAPYRYQAIFAAPAINVDFIANHSLKLDRSPSIIERSFVFTNRKDRAIRAAQALIRRQLPDAESTIKRLSNAGKLQVGEVFEVDVSDEAGRGHRVEGYTRSEKLQRIVAEVVNHSASKRREAFLVGDQ